MDSYLPYFVSLSTGPAWWKSIGHRVIVWPLNKTGSREWENRKNLLAKEIRVGSLLRNESTNKTYIFVFAIRKCNTYCVTGCIVNFVLLDVLSTLIINKINYSVAVQIYRIVHVSVNRIVLKQGQVCYGLTGCFDCEQLFLSSASCRRLLASKRTIGRRWICDITNTENGAPICAPVRTCVHLCAPVRTCLIDGKSRVPEVFLLSTRHRRE